MLLPHGLMVLVVDGGRMRLLRNDGSDAAPHLRIVEEAHNDVPPTHLLGADEPGHTFQSAGTGRSAYEAPDLHTRRETEFGIAALGRLEARTPADAPAVLIAPPQMLGRLRKKLDPALEGRIVAQFDKDLAAQPPAAITGFLRNQKQWKPMPSP